MANNGGTLKSSSMNGVKLYSITGQHRNPASWINPKKQRALRKDLDYQQRVELIQDLRFETATTKIRATPDGEFLIASGIYPPQVKVYELRELSLKREGSEVVGEGEGRRVIGPRDKVSLGLSNFSAKTANEKREYGCVGNQKRRKYLQLNLCVEVQSANTCKKEGMTLMIITLLALESKKPVLSDDYSKLAFLCADRSINLHAKYGRHYSLRIPRMGRNMIYDPSSCDLLCVASSPDLYRINLSQGRFLSPLATQSPALNVVSRSKLHGLVACGGEDGAVECFDMRSRSSIRRINAISTAGENDQEVTAIAFDEDVGFQMVVGSSEGKVLIYDLRPSQPLRVKDHIYGSPILDIKWHRTLNSKQPKIVTTDKHIVKIWDPETVSVTSIEPTGGAINDICVFKESGLILLALDSSQIPPYFIPALGPAPKWCSYLENLTEELEENVQPTIYDDYKFLTREELERLSLSNLIGTNLVRAYMHGFFINYQLYKKVKDLAEPFDYKAYSEQRIKEKLDKEGRITMKRRLPKVNREKARELLENEEAEKETDADANKPSKKKKKTISSDILNDDRFTDFFEKPEFQIDEKSQEYMALHRITSKKLVEEHFEPVDDEMTATDSEASASSEDEGAAGTKARIPRLYEVKDERHAQAFLESVSLANEDALPLGERVAALEDKQKASHTSIKVGPCGSREISFVSKSKEKYKEDDDDEDPRRSKRGVHSLGLKPTSYEKRIGGRGNRGRGRGRGRGGGRGRGRH
ncbi:hypothetical protein RND81_03G056200 [Saponaria officinalis]|uniref:Nucleolar protein 10 n=1 Tax=Saponaria officinalis TaxID=3572 RepID=A0AAW1M1G6_SAPOF